MSDIGVIYVETDNVVYIDAGQQGLPGPPGPAGPMVTIQPPSTPPDGATILLRYGVDGIQDSGILIEEIPIDGGVF